MLLSIDCCVRTLLYEHIKVDSLTNKHELLSLNNRPTWINGKINTLHDRNLTSIAVYHPQFLLNSIIHINCDAFIYTIRGARKVSDLQIKDEIIINETPFMIVKLSEKNHPRVIELTTLACICVCRGVFVCDNAFDIKYIPRKITGGISGDTLINTINGVVRVDELNPSQIHTILPVTPILYKTIGHIRNIIMRTIPAYIQLHITPGFAPVKVAPDQLFMTTRGVFPAGELHPGDTLLSNSPRLTAEEDSALLDEYRRRYTSLQKTNPSGDTSLIYPSECYLIMQYGIVSRRRMLICMRCDHQFTVPEVSSYTRFCSAKCEAEFMTQKIKQFNDKIALLVQTHGFIDTLKIENVAAVNLPIDVFTFESLPCLSFPVFSSGKNIYGIG